MILIDTSLYITALEVPAIELLLEKLANKEFIQSCEMIDREIHQSVEFLRKKDRKQDAEKLKIIYEQSHEGSITTTDHITSLAEQYQEEANLSKKQQKNIAADFIIVASASVAGVKKILSFNRRTMCDDYIIQVYRKVNQRNKLTIPSFITTEEDLRKFLQLP